MIRKFAALTATLLAVSLPAAASGIDSISVEAGRGDDRTNLIRVGVQSNWDKSWALGEAWRVGGYWELSIGAWKGPLESAADFALTPVFRFERQAGHATYYVEAAIGFHIVSYRISADDYLSTNFQFGDHLGIGARFGAGRRYDLQLRVQHLSNGGISEPNPGIDFAILRFQYHFE